MSADWFRRAFDEDYLDIYLHRDLNEAARAAALLERELQLSPGMSLLDLCCGPGRHLCFLGRRVRRAVGLDLSPALLRRAAEHWRAGEGMDFGVAQPPPAGHPPSWPLLVRGDMRRLPFADAAFDRVVNLFTSFGYFVEEAENQAVLHEVVRVLKPGGMLAIDHINRDAMLAALEPCSERRLADGRRVVEHREYDPAARRVNKQVEVVSELETRCWRESVRVYDPDELEQMLREAGLEPLFRLGDYKGSPWRDDSPRLLIFVRKAQRHER